MFLRRHFVVAFTVLAAAAVATAQTHELIAVDFAGTAFGISPTGQKRTIGPTGVGNCNAMARLGDQLYVSAKNGNVHQLAVVDAITGVATVVVANLGFDLRGLTANSVFGPGQPELLGIANLSDNADVLVGIDVDTFAVTVVGPTGRTAIQSLESEGSTLWAWDLTAGLLRVDRTSGLATDPFPTVGTQGASIQYLAVDHLSRLVGGNSSLYRIDPNTGVVTLLGSDGFVDLRGAERHFGRVTAAGAGCPVGVGGTTLVGGGEAMPGTSIGIASTGHTANTTGVLLIGLAAQSLPIVGSPCLQLVSGDSSIPVTAGTSGLVKRSIPLPNAFAATLHLQLLTFENVPGGVVATNRLTVEIPH